MRSRPRSRSFPSSSLPRALDEATILDAVLLDKKKTRSGKVRFVMLESIGATVSDDGVSEGDLRAALRFLRQRAR